MKSNLLTKSEYARQRGVNPSAVTKAINEGRITIVSVNGRELIDPVAADAQWAANSRRRVGSGPAVQPRHQAAEPAHLDPRRVREDAEAQIAMLRLGELRGELIRVDAVRLVLSARITELRERFLGIADRIAPELAALSEIDACHRLVDVEIRQALESFGRGDMLNKGVPHEAAA